MAHSDREFTQELDTYRRHRAELLRTAAGKFAVLQGERLVGVYEGRADAEAAAELLRPAPVLIKQVERIEKLRRAFFPKC